MDFPAPAEFDHSLSEIDPTLENSDIFMRYSTVTPGIDFEHVGGYFLYDDLFFRPGSGSQQINDYMAAPGMT